MVMVKFTCRNSRHGARPSESDLIGVDKVLPDNITILLPLLTYLQQKRFSLLSIVIHSAHIRCTVTR